MNHPGLDRLSPSRKEGWRRLAEAPDRTRPPALSRPELDELDDESRERYDDACAEWHANLGPLRTPQLAAVHEDLWELVDANRQDADRVRGAAAIDAFPGLGKSTTANAFAKRYHQREIRLRGRDTAGGNEHLPVCRIGLTSNTTMKGFNRAILNFYGHPGVDSGSAEQLASRALDCVLNCGTGLVVVDDVHFLNMDRRDGLEVSNHLKWLANEFPVTFLFVGVGLRDKGLMSEGMTGAGAARAQTGRRWTRLSIDPFEVSTEPGRRAWRDLLLGIEQRLVLTDLYPGMLADDLSDYLFVRSTGHIGSLIDLVMRGCHRAVRSGTERLTVEQLDRVRIDEAAEQARRALQASLETGRLTTRPQCRRRAHRGAQAA